MNTGSLLSKITNSRYLSVGEYNDNRSFVCKGELFDGWKFGKRDRCDIWNIIH